MGADGEQKKPSEQVPWSSRDRLDIRLQLLSSVIQQTVAADAKSVAILFISGALFTLLAAGRGSVHEADSILRSVLGVTAIIATGSALVVALVALFPRMAKPEKATRPLFFAHAGRLSVPEYSAAFRAIEIGDELLKALDVEYVKASAVATRKHSAIKHAVVLLSTAAVAITLFTLLPAAPRSGSSWHSPASVDPNSKIPALNAATADSLQRSR